MHDTWQHIAGGEKLIAAHGRRPTFHDAEIVEIHFWRGQMKPGDWDDSNVLPVLTIKVLTCIELPDTYPALATLRFEDVNDFQMSGFNHQNAILEISIAIEARGSLTNGEELPPFLEGRV